MKRRTFVRTGLAAAAGLALPRPARSALWSAPPPGWRDILDSDLPGRDLVAVTGNGQEVLLTEGALAELARSLRGRLLLPEDEPAAS